MSGADLDTPKPDRAVVRILFGILELYLQPAAVRVQKALPINFEIAGESWRFDPASPHHFAPEPHPAPALTLRMSASLLGRLLLEPGALITPDDRIDAEGDVAALDVLVGCFDPGKNWLSVRMHQ